MISNLQFLRAVAAIAVVFYHTRYQLHGVSTSFQGVALFFVISGFIMTYITREDTKNFYAKRLIRIIPLYWLSTFLFIILTNLGITNPASLYPLIQSCIKKPLHFIGWLVSVK
jgi:exopolysaccharide production protein ExoZ